MYKILLIISYLFTHVKLNPQIFNDVYEFCEYTVHTERKKIRSLRMHNEVFSINLGDSHLYYSYCRSVKLENICKRRTLACLIRKNTIIDLGNVFETKFDFNVDLISQNGAVCRDNSNMNYTLIVHLGCGNSIKINIPEQNHRYGLIRILFQAQPRLNFKENCIYEVNAIHPDCQPTCTAWHEGNFLDLRSWPIEPLSATSENNTFSVALCHPNPHCRSNNVHACAITVDGANIPFYKSGTQTLRFDRSSNEVLVKGYFGERRNRTNFEAKIKCNWNAVKPIIYYKKPKNQGSHYKFEIESTFGCVKLPSKCVISDDDGYIYRLSSLNNPKGFWSVSNVKPGQMKLNICGNLELSPENECSKKYSQICYKSGNTYLSYGTTSAGFKIGDDSIKIHYEYGSACGDKFYSTEIELICSRQNAGPKLLKIENCTVFIQWHTPSACPIWHSRGRNCTSFGRFGKKDYYQVLNTQKTHQLSANSRLIYNLCGAISQTCNGFSNVTACLKNEKGERVIAWQTIQPEYYNSLLEMSFSGEMCDERSERKLKVVMQCSYEETYKPTVQVVRDDCEFRMALTTSAACLSKPTDFKDCAIVHNNCRYDLNALVLKNRNYIIRDPKENIDFIFNVCGPVITGPDVFCPNSSICLRNNKEANIKKRFTSLGRIINLTHRDENVIIENTFGHLCMPIGYYKTIFIFKCAQKENYYLNKKSECLYEFVYETKRACSQRLDSKCTLRSIENSNRKIDLYELKTKVFNVNLMNYKYMFDLCENAYTICTKENCTIHNLKRDYSVANETHQILMNLNSLCSDGQTISQMIIDLHCDLSNPSVLEKISMNQCLYHVRLSTSLICPLNKTVEKSTIVERTEMLNIPAIPEKLLVCYLKNNFSSYQVRLDQLISHDDIKTNNIDNFECGTYDCDVNVKQSIKECPYAEYNYNSFYIVFKYKTAKICYQNKLYPIEYRLYCDQNTIKSYTLQNDCKIVAVYHSEEICKLLIRENASNLGLIFGVIGSLTVLCLITVIYLYKTKGCWNNYNSFRNNDKSNVFVYKKDVYC